MLKFYCPECGKRGYCAYFYFIALLVIGITIGSIFVGCEDKVGANTRKIYADPNASWVFEGTFCSKCNQLYNYIEHPKICDKCGEQTKDYYYLVLIKER